MFNWWMHSHYTLGRPPTFEQIDIIDDLWMNIIFWNSQYAQISAIVKDLCSSVLLWQGFAAIKYEVDFSLTYCSQRSIDFSFQL